MRFGCILLQFVVWISFVSIVRGAETNTPINVMVSILPHVDMVERIGGDTVRVEAIVQPGHSPATYDVTPRQMTALAEADVFFRVGVPFENGLIPKLQKSIPNLPIVDTRRGITLVTMTTREPAGLFGQSGDDHHSELPRAHTGSAHHHHEGCDHQHSGPDPHIWLSPRLLAKQAETICQTLVSLNPSAKAIYEANLSKLTALLAELDAELSRMFSGTTTRKFMVYHPSWGYFADAYGLIQVAIETDGKSPPARQLAQTIDLAKSENIHVIFTQPQFSTKSAETIADAIGGTVVAIDPLAKDLFTSIRQAATAIMKGLSQ